eukprot:TRINITY_DN308_c2_g1_i1.p1 TRINITY_DN308_c2_g1~~TRINITY_DN308_c2_g1_i1.p1  ORF type:complete len:339 (-),score=79.94 TRINITY_DN308_c2_g1_i1:260-1276(-)
MAHSFLFTNLTKKQVFGDGDMLAVLFGSIGEGIEQVNSLLDLMTIKDSTGRTSSQKDSWIGDNVMLVGEYTDLDMDVSEFAKITPSKSDDEFSSEAKNYDNVILLNVSKKQFVFGKHMKSAKYLTKDILSLSLAYLMIDMTSQGSGSGDLLHRSAKVLRLEDFYRYERDPEMWDSTIYTILGGLDYDANYDDLYENRVIGSWVNDFVMAIDGNISYRRDDIPSIDEIMNEWTNISAEVGYGLYWCESINENKFCYEVDDIFSEKITSQLARMIWLKEQNSLNSDGSEQFSILDSYLPIDTLEFTHWTSVCARNSSPPLESRNINTNDGGGFRRKPKKT